MLAARAMASYKQVLNRTVEFANDLRSSKEQTMNLEGAFEEWAVVACDQCSASYRASRPTLIKVKHNVGAATLLISVHIYGQQISRIYLARTYLIHMLAKQETPMKDSRTVLGLVPATLKTRVIRTRSMLVLDRAEAIVNPPIKSMIVGENMTENMYLSQRSQRRHVNTNLVCSLGGIFGLETLIIGLRTSYYS